MSGRLVVVAAVIVSCAVTFFLLSREEVIRGDEPGVVAVLPERVPELVREPTLSVTVTSSNAPLAGARIIATLRTPGSSLLRPRWEQPLETVTDVEGLARLTATRGTWFVLVKKDGFAAVARDVVIETDTRIVVSLEAGFELRGTAVDQSGNAVSPARIDAIPLGEQLTSRTSVPDGVKRVVVEPSGAFALQGLSRGWWRLEGDAEGFGRSEPVVIRVPTTESIRLVFRPFGFIEGFVVNAKEKATVTIVGEDETTTVDCSASGAFSLERPAGAYHLSARAGELVGSVDEPVFVRARATTSVTITLAGKGATLRGRVTGDDGLPVNGATVLISAALQTTTDAEGRWKFEHLAPGAYDIRATADGMSATEETGFHLVDGDDVELRLVISRLGSVSGKVVGATDAVVVTLQSAHGQFASRQATTDSAGLVAFTDVPAGDVIVRASPSIEDSGASTNATVVAGKNTEVTVELPKRFELRVELDRSGCSKVEDVRLLASEPDGLGSFVQTLVTSKATTLQLGRGKWRLRATSGTSCAAEADVVLNGSATRTLRLVAVPLLLRVAVVEANEDPAPYASVVVLTKEGTQHFAMTDIDGRTSLAVKREMISTLSARKDGRSARMVGPPTSDSVSLKLSPAARLRVRLDGADALTRLTVLSADGDGEPIEARTGGHDVVLTAVPAGELEVRASNFDDTKFGSSTVIARAGETVETTVRLSGVGSLIGSVVMPLGVQSQARVSVTSKFGTMVKQLAHDGAFTFGPMPDGEYSVDVRCTGCSWPTQLVKINGAETRVEFR